MKKTLRLLSFLLVVIAGTVISSCSDKDKDEYVPLDQIPAQSQTFLSTYYPDVEAITVNKETDDGYVQYEVRLANGHEVTFDAAGAWIDVDAPIGKSIPQGIALPEIEEYVETNFQGAGINEISKTDLGGYGMELTTGLDLIFSSDGKFLSYDY